MLVTLTAAALLGSNQPLCTSAYNCSLNGECVSGGCQCDVQWKGEYCEQLNLMPVRNRTGLHGHLVDNKTSTWGGAVIRDDDGLYHMFASELEYHCGIHRWLTNSVVRHCTSNDPLGEFTPREVVLPIFAHEPAIARAPNGDYVLYVTQNNGPPTNPNVTTCHCTDGSSASGNCNWEPGVGQNQSVITYFTTAKTLNGPWSELVSLNSSQTNPKVDQNFVAVIAANKSLLGWNRWDVYQADDYSNPNTYKNTGYAMKPELKFGIGEDPFLWKDKNGFWHLLSHNGKRGELGDTGDCGRHFFSLTGLAGTWDAAPLPNGGCAFPRNPEFENGENHTFYRRERPHLIFAEDGTTPLSLTTSAIDSPVYGDDASFTLLQGIYQHN